MAAPKRGDAQPNYAPLDAAWDEPRGTRPGHYAGVGPKGYRRTDARILEDVSDELTRHPHLDAQGIEVSCDQGEVTLSGSVRTRRCKRIAEDAALAQAGVRDVHNRLRIQESGQIRPTDGIDEVASLGMKDYADHPVY